MLYLKLFTPIYAVMQGKDAFPSQKLLCEDLGISKNTLGKYIKELKDGGYITAVQHKEKGKFTRNIYTINMVLCTKSAETSERDSKSIDHNKKKSREHTHWRNEREKRSDKRGT